MMIAISRAVVSFSPMPDGSTNFVLVRPRFVAVVFIRATKLLILPATFSATTFEESTQPFTNIEAIASLRVIVSPAASAAIDASLSIFLSADAFTFRLAVIFRC